MLFVFEDHEEDIISKFFRQAYPSETSKKFVYAKGNSNIKTIVCELLRTTDEMIVVYLDTIPGNKETAKIYRELQRVSQKEQYRVIVLPIVCMEYYLIKALQFSQVMVKHTGVDVCVDRMVYFQSPLIVTEEDKKYVKNFEKYCKLILIKNLKECACHSGKASRECYGVYYSKDCLCEFSESECMEEKLIEKAINYLSQFDFIPNGKAGEVSQELSIEDVWEIHRRLVQEYNDMVQIYINSGIVDTSQYKKITEIR